MKHLVPLALLALALTACGSAATNTSTAPTPQPTLTAQPQIYLKVGQSAAILGYRVSINSQKIVQNLPTGWEPLPSNQHLLVFDVTITNTAHVAVDVSMFQFHLYDNDGNQANQLTPVAPYQWFDRRGLPPGSKTHGQMLFNIERTVTSYTLSYTPNVSDTQLLWNITA